MASLSSLKERISATSSSASMPAPADTQESSNAVEEAEGQENPNVGYFKDNFPYAGKTLDEMRANLDRMTKQCEEEHKGQGAQWSKSLGLPSHAYRKHKFNLNKAIETEESALLAP